MEKVTWLQANKYYSTKEYATITAVKKAWINQHHTKSQTIKYKVAAVLRDNDSAAGELDDDGDLFDDHNDASILSSCSTWSNLTNPALVHQEKKTTCRK